MSYNSDQATQNLASVFREFDTHIQMILHRLDALERFMKRAEPYIQMLELLQVEQASKTESQQ